MVAKVQETDVSEQVAQRAFASEQESNCPSRCTGGSTQAFSLDAATIE
jgi:hypothetical protein